MFGTTQYNEKNLFEAGHSRLLERIDDSGAGVQVVHDETLVGNFDNLIVRHVLHARHGPSQ